MKTVNGFKLTALFALLLGFGMFTKGYAQTTTWVFDAADNSGYMIQVKTVGSQQSVQTVNLGKKGDAAWTGTDIQQIDDYETYIRVKSKGTGRIYELNINWYDGKIVLTRPEGTEVVYWLRES